MIKQCVICGADFQARGLKKTCGDACSKEHRVRVTREWIKGNKKHLRASYRAKAREYRNRDLRRHFGIDIDTYESMIQRQGARCFICEEPFAGKRDTGRVRKILCDMCNRGIGMLKEDPRIIESALRYVRQQKRINKYLGPERD